MKLLNRSAISKILSDSPEIVRPSVIETYESLHRGVSISAKTTFLAIPKDSLARFVSLPAHVASAKGPIAAGAKWVSNFRDNVARGLPPLNTLLLLSETDTGAPLACMEGSELNLRRTAASAFLVAERFNFDPKDGPIGIVGAGALAEAFCAELIQTYSSVHSVQVSDILPDRATDLVGRLLDNGVKATVETTKQILQNASIIILCTSAESPWIDVEMMPTDRRMILHISADDLPSEYFSRVINVTDRVTDVASLPVSLGRAIAEGLDSTEILELPALLEGEPISTSRPVVFSPFGLSVLDIALAERVFRIAESTGAGIAWDHRG